MSELDRLFAWLKEVSTSDVVMVARKGTKHPAFPHAHHQWDWVDVDAVRCSPTKVFDRDYDVGILLDSLCVVDVDDVKLARELEARYPALQRAPCERTRKGSHYYFRRSATCDAEGFYDGAGQRTRGIDLKTRCHNGTRGFVLCAPSTDKAWVAGREPWNSSGVEEIPDCLLRAVALPRHPSVNVTLSFSGDDADFNLGAAHVDDRAAAMHFAVIEDLASMAADDIGCEPCLGGCVPLHNCSRGQFEALIFTCRYGVPREFPTPHATAGLLRAADFLGADAYAVRAYRAAGVVNRLLEVERLSPALARHMHAEALARASAGPWPALVPAQPGAARGVDVSAVAIEVEAVPDPAPVGAGGEQEAAPARRGSALGVCMRAALGRVRGFVRSLFRLADRPRHAPAAAEERQPPDGDGEPATNDCWLLPRLRSIKERCDAAIDLKEAPEVPPFAERWLRAFDRLVLAGGGALSAVSTVPHSSDYDFFVCHADPSEAEAIAEGIVADPDVRVIHRSPIALTFEVDGRHIAQLILRIYDSHEHLLGTFDFDACKVLVFADGLCGQLTAMAAPSFHESLRLRAVVVREDAWGAASYVRTLKYMAKGFDVYVPCAIRKHFVSRLRGLETGSGVAKLYAMEQELTTAWERLDLDRTLRSIVACSTRGDHIERLQEKRARQEARFVEFYRPQLEFMIRIARRHFLASEYGVFRRMPGVALLMQWCKRFVRGMLQRRARQGAREGGNDGNDAPVVQWQAAPRNGNLCPRPFEWKRVVEPEGAASWRRDHAARLIARTDDDIEPEFLDHVLNPACNVVRTSSDRI